jgi:hypothetical protein
MSNAHLIEQNHPLNSEQDCTEFAEAAFAERQFELIVRRFGTELDREAQLRPLVSSWVGRAKFELGQFSEARCILVEAISECTTLPDWARLTLQHSVWRDQSPFIETVPTLLHENLEAFHRVVTGLLYDGDTNSPLPDGRYTIATLAMYWAKIGIKTIVLNPRERGPEAELVSLGIDPSFLEAVTRGPNGVSEVCAEKSPDIPFATDPNLSPRLFDVAGSVLLGAKPVLCPFTGTRSLARDSLDLYVYL